MAEAFIYDAVRTPRGRGKSSGSLHKVKPVELLATALRALQLLGGGVRLNHEEGLAQGGLVIFSEHSIDPI